jgi:hypothetical protein
MIHTELSGFAFGALTTGAAFMVVWLLNFLGERRDKEDSEHTKCPLCVCSQITGTKNSQFGKAQHPHDKNGGRPSCTQIYRKVSEHDSNSPLLHREGSFAHAEGDNMSADDEIKKLAMRFERALQSFERRTMEMRNRAAQDRAAQDRAA